MMKSTDVSRFYASIVIFTFLLAYNFIPATGFAQQNDLGNIDFPTSGKTEAQKDFIMGMLLLHSFEYDDAVEHFRAAQRKDTGFVMAYWGEAMTHNHPIWFQQEKSKALRALNKIAPAPAARIKQCKLPIEKEFIRAADILYGEGTKKERDDI